VFQPPVVSKLEGPIATLTSGTLSGGVNWPGSGYDPELHTFFSHACNACISPLGLVAPPKEFSTLDYVMGTAGSTFRPIVGGGEGEAADAPKPAAPPPPPPPPPPAAGGRGGAPPAGGGFGATVQGLSIGSRRTARSSPSTSIAAISCGRRRGDTPDAVRNHPALKGSPLSRPARAATSAWITKTLVISGDPSVTTTPEHPRGAMLRAYDKTNGKEVGAVWLPAPNTGSAMTHARRAPASSSASAAATTGRGHRLRAAGRSDPRDGRVARIKN
jgi:quinoprotein glucose dehydrogenase